MYLPNQYTNGVINFSKQIQAALSSLEEALNAGFEDFKVINPTASYIVIFAKLA